MFNFFRTIIKNKSLIFKLSKREIEKKYRGTIFGLLWSIFTPLLMLIIYTFIFSVVFSAKWGGDAFENTKGSFAIILFSGLIFFNLLADCLSSSPSLILFNSVYVKKVVFPLEILPIVSFVGSLFNFFISYIILIIGYVLVFHHFSLYLLVAPLFLIPFSLLSLGLSYFLSSVGVFIRDLGNLIGILITVLMFTSPIFYPLSAIPEKYQMIIRLSPVTIIIEEVRKLLFSNGNVNFPLIWIYFAVSIIVFVLGVMWFQKTKKGFADVI